MRRPFMQIVPALGALAAVTLLAGCPSRDVSAVDPRQAKELDKEIPVNLSRDIDLLFVIDNSISMRQEQDSLAANFPAFIDVLRGIEGGLPNARIAVISSDMGIGGLTEGNCTGTGDNGQFRLGELNNCALTDGKRYITTDPANYGGSLEDTFACMALVGNNGCGFEQHLESMKAALSGSQGQEFLRPDAYLAVIIIADEDDCSARPENASTFFTRAPDNETGLGFFSSFRCWEYGVVCNDDSPGPRDMPADGTPSGRINCVPRDDSQYVQRVSSYVDFLKGLKADPNRVLVAGILGDPAPVQVRRRNIDQDDDLEYDLMASCSTPGIGDAAPSTRLTAFLNSFPNRSVFQTICPADGSLAGALNQIAELLRAVVGTPCLEGEIADSDPNTDGIQPDCRVTDVQYYNTDQAIETSIPPCTLSGGRTPCYNIVQSADCTQFPSGLAIEVDYGGGEPAPETTRLVRCVAE
jgi:hypothetical protein